MLLDLIMGGNIRDIVVGLLLGIPAVVICLTFHEAAHGFTAYLLGDRTAQASGRLTLDPLAHIDPWGFACMMLLGFGWARPVPVNISQLKNRRWGMGLVAAAGPVSNFLLGFLAYFAALVINIKFYPVSGFSEILTLFFSYIGAMSVGLGIFNLIPIHPLDGSRILDAILPFRLQVRYQNFMNRYGAIILLAVIAFLWIGGLSWLIVGARQTVLGWALTVVRLFL
ncbi:MAG: site-2 protease family protein [Butyricicoccus sp.]|nr:site-2 protease family protein [Butyricicoccus sp.]